VSSAPPLEARIRELLRGHSLTLATAESITGGLIGSRITDIPGSSDYFLGGIIAYSNDAKVRLLGVSEETLTAHGAVSDAVAREMAQGARHRLGADVAVAVTGIAGPTGATERKANGLTYVALAAPDVELCRECIWTGDRIENKRLTAEAALALLYEYLVPPLTRDRGS
jgi:PncC family amidohydrolase